MPAGEVIALAAREWLGTPFQWGQACKGKGADCKGLIAGVARECGRPEADSVEALDTSYGANVPQDALRVGLERLFDQVPYDARQPGDILLIRVANRAQHLAIYVGAEKMIHTYSKGPRCVVESPIGMIWRRAVDSVWRWRDDG